MLSSDVGHTQFTSLTCALRTGQFGKVYKATLVRARSENMTVAVKTIKKYKSEQETSDFLHEMGVMMDLMHPNIIHLYGIVQQGFMPSQHCMLAI